MADKKLETKHAHITGQAMRGHWGPIVDRIADEITDPRDAFINDLISENERLREALKPFAELGFPYAVEAMGETNDR